MSYEEIALRAWAEPVGSALSFARSDRRFRLPEYALVIDTETTVDISQALNFGSYRFIALDDGENPPGSCLEEGIFYADELPERYPEGLAVLEGYASEHEADLDVPRYRKPLHLFSRREFVRQVFLRAAYRARALVVGFNLPFDLSRIAIDVKDARRSYGGGFSFALWDYEKGGLRHLDPNRPRLDIRSLNPRQHFFRFTDRRIGDPEDYDERIEPSGDKKRVPFTGHFLDLHTLTFALTAKKLSLDNACAAFGLAGKDETKRHGVITPRYIEYNRRDVKATGELLMKALEEFSRHPIRLQVTKAFSPASIAKSYQDTMGIEAVLARQPDFDRQLLGYAMNSFYGGRAECRIRRVGLPVVYTDFASMYPSVNALLENWQLLTAREIYAVEATDEVRRFLEGVTLADCFSAATWQRLRAFVKVKPCGEIYPVRVRYDPHGPSWQIGANPLANDEGQWFALPDVVAAKLASGHTPEVIEAFRLEAEGRQSGLHKTKLRGAVAVNPRNQDFFRVIVEERKRTERSEELDEAERERLSASLKVTANAGSYGIFAQMDRKEQPAGRKVPVVFWNADGERCETRVSAPEEPGPFCFPPLAAMITAAARLMLTLLECTVRERGGAHVFCDTDSLAIVASKKGGLLACPGGQHRLPDGREAVKALSWSEVEEVVNEFAALNPYDHEAVPGSVLDLEKENLDKDSGLQRELYCYAISAKRYVLYQVGDDGQPLIRKFSRHGLGHLMNPTNPDSRDDNWIEQVWRYILALDVFGQKTQEPDWFARPALARVAINDPTTLSLFAAFNDPKPYAKQVKPHNFLLSAQVALLGHPPGVDPTKPFHLIAPYHNDPRQWLKLRFTDRYNKTGATYRVTTGDAVAEGVARVKTYGDVVADYRFRPEHKSLAPDGQPCAQTSAGLLQRRPVEVVRPVYVGKESNHLEEVEHLLIEDEDEVMNEYADARNDPFARFVVPVLRTMSRRSIVNLSGLDQSTVKRIRAGKQQPHAKNRDRLREIAAKHARAALGGSGDKTPSNDFLMMKLYLQKLPVDDKGSVG